MLSPALFLPLLAIVASSQNDQSVTVRGYPWAPFISPMGEPFRGSNQSPIARWFGQADRNGDGRLTADEMQADADRFFTRLDTNRDGQIDPPEVVAYEWEIAPEIQVNSEWRRKRGEPRPKAASESDRLSAFGRRPGDAHDGYRADGLQGAARYGLLNIPQPVAGADADFNRVVTLAEFRQAASYRFRLLDERSQGQLTLAELEARLPNRPKGKPAKPDKNDKDRRLGLPLPGGD